MPQEESELDWRSYSNHTPGGRLFWYRVFTCCNLVSIDGGFSMKYGRIEMSNQNVLLCNWIKHHHSSFVEPTINRPSKYEFNQRNDSMKKNHKIEGGSFHLYNYVSDKALSGVLYQIQGDKFKVIWFHSRKLTDTQKRFGDAS
ncbi:hypothetical protein ACTFIW_005514 [Dictyostelium discoideum]